MVGSSILPVSIHKGRLYFLFGKENEFEDSAHGYSDFGGGIEPGETAFETACREGGEELTGFLGDGAAIARLLRGRGRVLRLGDPKKYIIHIVRVDYDENLPKYYNNNHRFLWDRMNRRVLSKTKLFEKIEIDWFSESDIRRRIREFRPFYADILREHVLPVAGKIKKFAAAARKKRTLRRGGGRGRSTTRNYNL
jgi:8-oxo-dGTP pyrophosphatase MutT (NUDIX family)